MISRRLPFGFQILEALTDRRAELILFAQRWLGGFRSRLIRIRRMFFFIPFTEWTFEDIVVGAFFSAAKIASRILPNAILL